MTKTNDRTKKTQDREAAARREESDERPELDAEIVRDLEVEGDADDARGGMCAFSCAFTCMITGSPLPPAR